MSNFTSLAQKQSFDILHYSLPAGWQKTENENGVQLAVTDQATGQYALALLTKSAASTTSAGDNFSNHWSALVKPSVNISGELTMLAPARDKQWDIISGWAYYTDGNRKGMAIQKTATGYGKTVTVIIMSNTDKYKKELDNFFGSVELPALTVAPATHNNSSGAAEKNTLVGLWASYVPETSGHFSNGTPMYTAGYFRHEYLFYADGTYRFLDKVFSVYMKNIFFGYETGTWSVNGNTLTITPAAGKNEEWSKSASGKSNDWGSLLKTTTRKLETVPYTFELKYLSGMQQTYLMLQYNKATEREGSQQATWSYSPRNDNESNITLPPGKQIVPNKAQTATNTQAATAASSPLAGKIWEGTSMEKFTNGFNTGGFFTGQYKFNNDGTYRFVKINASNYVDTKSLGYETGTYTISNDKLTITPAQGRDEEWSKTGKTSNGNSDVTNRKINDSWGKKLKTGNRKLEPVTYTFNVQYQEGNRANALILQRNGPTEREGNGNTSYYFETGNDRSASLPGGIQ